MKKLLVVLFIILLPGCISASQKKGMLDSIVQDNITNIIFKEDMSLDTDVILSLKLLEGEYSYNLEKIFTDCDTTLEDVKSNYLTKEITSVSVAYNMTVVYDFLNLDTTSLKNYFNSDFTYNEYDYNSIVRSLKILNINDTLKTSLTNELIQSFTDGYNDADTISMKIITLGLDSPKEALSMLKTYITKDGVLGYDGEANASSTAQTILALLCLGEDLCCDHTYDGKNIEDMLYDFYTEDGFKNKIDDEEVDLKFASPQGFLAVSAMYTCDHCVLVLF